VSESLELTAKRQRNAGQASMANWKHTFTAAYSWWHRLCIDS